ncbi:MAG: hypothetical protein K9N48_05965 [Verrucomicrobia bacterium]|nr:hypothetical protein [Verrucomicrobiota bacterium]MCF7707976.1 hypothetical protein [Verrucomicrobiota bacterium]
MKWLKKSLLTITLCLFSTLQLITAAASETDDIQKLLQTLNDKIERNPTNTSVLLKLGDLYHDMGADGNEDAVSKAEKYLNKLLDIEPTNAMGRVLLGSVTTMKARDTIWPFSQVKFVREGNKVMDAAVEAAPRDPHVRFIRAVNNYHMPAFLGREKVAHDDFQWLWRVVSSNPDEFEPEFRQKIGLFWGRLLKKNNEPKEAFKVWSKSLEWGEQTSQTEELKKAISSLPSDAKESNKS